MSQVALGTGTTTSSTRRQEAHMGTGPIGLQTGKAFNKATVLL